MKKLISLLAALVLVVSVMPTAVSAAVKEPTSTASSKQATKHQHKYNMVRHNMKNHWYACACGSIVNTTPHVDPRETTNDTCTCGFHFSSNADLVTLWVDGCPPIEDFDKDTTEYTLHTNDYKDVSKIKIRYRVYDVQSTVELPEELTLEEGTNTFEVKVTAGNLKDTKTYTLTIIKESK